MPHPRQKISESNRFWKKPTENVKNQQKMEFTIQKMQKTNRNS